MKILFVNGAERYVVRFGRLESAADEVCPGAADITVMRAYELVSAASSMWNSTDGGFDVIFAHRSLLWHTVNWDGLVPADPLPPPSTPCIVVYSGEREFPTKQAAADWLLRRGIQVERLVFLRGCDEGIDGWKHAFRACQPGGLVESAWTTRGADAVLAYLEGQKTSLSLAQNRRALRFGDWLERTEQAREVMRWRRLAVGIRRAVGP